ncbi:hypothetical protein ACFQS1_23950 [Paractinoplanes rhizophilus]|uniref:Uncharacterized protein n=1 Tax=Paractinoplanes rhizophilus TaxID=1416877 RepID=A0ABW2HW52_9ACTN
MTGVTPAELRAMQRAVQRDWTPDCPWRIGDLARPSPSSDDRRARIRRLHHRLGFRDAGRTVTYARE